MTEKINAPLTEQLDELTRLIQGWSSAEYPNLYPTMRTSASFNPTGDPLDTCGFENIVVATGSYTL